MEVCSSACQYARFCPITFVTACASQHSQQIKDHLHPLRKTVHMAKKGGGVPV